MTLLRSTILLEVGVRLVFRSFPAALRRLLAGRAIRIDGQPLDPDLQLLLRLERLTDAGTPAAGLARRRAHHDVVGPLAGGPPVPGVAVRPIEIPSSDPTDPRDIAARLYTPDTLPAGSPLMVYLHGGGWVTGSLTTHDAFCRYLATRAGVRLLAIDYRLAPEHPFPSAVGNACAAFRFARQHAAELGADPAAIALGGDSSGGNLAAVAAHLAVRAGEPGPDFLLLFYPPTDAVNRTPSRDLFRAGFMLTDEDIVWFSDYYMPPPIDRGDPRASILLADDLSGMPPTYLATAGFDPLRDEGERFAERLASAGVPVVLRRQSDLIHGFVNLIGLSVRCREAVAEAAGALQCAFALAGASGVDSTGIGQVPQETIGRGG